MQDLQERDNVYGEFIGFMRDYKFWKSVVCNECS